MRLLFRIILPIVIAMLVSIIAANGQYIVETADIGQDEGIAHRNVEKVVRDHQGYFYLLMRGAIQRYDGSSFSDVNLSEMADLKVKTVEITQLEVLTDGNIVLATGLTDQLFIIQPRSLKVSALSFEGKVLVSDGHLYSMTTRAGKTTIKEVQILPNKEVKYTNTAKVPFEPTQYLLSKNAAYLSGKDSSIYVWQDDILKPLNTKGRLIGNGKDVLLYSSDMVVKLDGTNSKIIAELPAMNLTILKKDKVGNIIASYSDAPRLQTKLYVLSHTLELQHYHHIVGVSRFYRDFWTDDASYKWMLVGYNGIQVVNVLRDGISIIAKNEKAKKGKFGNVIGGVATDTKGNIYFSKESRGIFQMVSQDSAALVHSKQVYENNYRNNERFYYSEFDEHFYNYGYRYDGTTDLYQSDFESKAFTKKNVPLKIVDLLPFAKDEVLVAGYLQEPKDGRLCSYNFESKTFSTIREGLPPLRSLYYDRQSQIYWVGTVAGLYIMDKGFQTLAVLDSRQDENTKHFLANDYIIMVNNFAKKMLLASYGGGVYVLNKETYDLERTIDMNSGLSNNSVVGVMPDNLGNCWATTFNGVNVIDSNFQVIRTLFDHQGLNDREFNSKAIAKDTKGHIYAGTLNGITRFDPQKIASWQETHGFDIVAIHTYTNGTSTKLEIAEKIEVKNSIDSLIIHHTFPDYYQFPFLKGTVQLDWDEAVSDISQQDGYVTLTNLKTGTQQLAFTTRSNQAIDSLNIDISQDYTLLWYLLGIVLGIALIAILSVKIIKHREKEKTSLNRQIAELELTSLQTQMNPHFIFNALGAIQYFIQTHDAEKADEYLSNFAMLMRRILESSKSKYISLKNEIDLLKLYIGLEAIRFENKFTYEIMLDDALDMDINVPPMIIQPYIENAINHGLYNLTDREGILTIKFTQVDEDTIRCTVTDNGVGRKRAQELRTKRHKSRGMQIVKERIDTINTANEVQVSINTEDLMEDGKAAGTKAIIIIKDNP